MNTIINGFYIEYIVGHTYCNVYKIGRVDEFNRLQDMELVYRSENWEDCIAYAERNTNDIHTI